MKIQGEDLAKIISLAVAGKESLDAMGFTHEAYQKRDERIPHIDRAQDIEVRWRWDCLWEGTRICEFGLPCGYDDAHIDTVLRKTLLP